MAVFLLPVLLGLGGRLLKRGAWWLNDFDAVFCAAWRHAHGLPIYTDGVSCPGGRPAAFVYLPQLAWMLSPLAHGPTVSPARMIYGLAYLAVTLWLLWAIFVRQSQTAPLGLRLGGLSLVTGSSLACGNIAAPCHALVLASGLGNRQRDWLIGCAIVAVSLVKPIFLTYLLIFAFQPRPLAQRVKAAGLTLGLAGVAAAVVWASGGAALDDWRASLARTVIDWQTGVGLLDDLARMGLRGDQALTQVLTLAFAGLMALAGLALVEGRRLGAEGRFLVAITLAQLTNPRLMDYDLLMMAPGMAVIAASAPVAWRRRSEGLLLAIYALSVVLNLAEQSRLQIRLGPALLAIFVLASAAMQLAHGPSKGWRRQPA